MDNLINQQQEYGCFNSTDILHISLKAIKLTLVYHHKINGLPIIL